MAIARNIGLGLWPWLGIQGYGHRLDLGLDEQQL